MRDVVSENEEKGFIKRLHKEFDKLDEKVDKLADFMDTEEFSQLAEIHQSLLRIQLSAMLTYWRCLRERLDLLTEV